ncbi:hypothetical protein DPMN_193396 [Dreissena polymorpha]|uniref:Uncharacterized protein n=1 Tax=Dreissena polymorpha TaxID=45954 RepID=A0A9D4BF53_DREPO|nr:hypothetical protein DPMN_193396 [Dreissena polymorpha]
MNQWQSLSQDSGISIVQDPWSVKIMQSEPQMPFDEIKPFNQKHSLLQQLLPLTPVKPKKSIDKYFLDVLVSTYLLVCSALTLTL